MPNPLIFDCCAEKCAAWVRPAAQMAGDYDYIHCESLTEARIKLGVKRANLVFLEYNENAPDEFLQFAKFLTGSSIPFIVLCRQAKDGFEGISAGALQMLIYNDFASAKYMTSQILNLIKNVDMSTGDSRKLKQEITQPIHKVITIGASTGGAEAVLEVLKGMPGNAPPIVAVMHMPPVFTRIYAERLHNVCKISAWEAADGDRLRPGLVLVARGDRHLTLNKDDNGYYVSVFDKEPVGGFKPSVNLFFESAAKSLKSAGIGVILTGMGSDGAEGLLKMRNAGAYTIGQDEESCVVYGMPKVAYQIGGVCVQADIKDISKKILEVI